MARLVGSNVPLCVKLFLNHPKGHTCYMGYRVVKPTWICLGRIVIKAGTYSLTCNRNIDIIKITKLSSKGATFT